MAQVKTSENKRRPDKMMLDSGATSHITSLGDRVGEKRAHSTPIHPADDSTMRPTHNGTRKVTFMTDHGCQRVKLSNTLVVPDASTSLLSVPALVRKDIGAVHACLCGSARPLGR